jgi:hypothetical protein
MVTRLDRYNSFDSLKMFESELSVGFTDVPSKYMGMVSRFILMLSIDGAEIAHIAAGRST